MIILLVSFSVYSNSFSNQYYYLQRICHRHNHFSGARAVILHHFNHHVLLTLLTTHDQLAYPQAIHSCLLLVNE